MGSNALIGRDAELDALRGRLASATRGNGGAVLVEGEPGIGKSELLKSAAAMAEAEGVAVVRGTATAFEADRPFSLFIDALDLAPDASEPDAAAIGDRLHGARDRFTDIRHAVSEQIVDLIERRALNDACLVIAEDVHWADPSSILVLHRLANSLSQMPVLLVVSLRPLPRSRELEDVLQRFAASDALPITLAPLPPEGVAALAREHLGARAGPELAKVLAGAGGNPLFVSELLRAMELEGLITRADGSADVAESTLPPSVTLTILRRMTFLSADALELLRIASILGSAFSLTDLARVTERSIQDLAPLIEEASKLGVLGARKDQVAFRHDLIRDAIYEDMLLPVRAALHHQVADALIAAGAPATRVAPHLSLGAQPGDMRAVEWLRAAAAEAPMAAVSCDLLSRAIELAGDPVPEDLRLDLIEALLDDGRAAPATEAAKSLVEETGSLRARRLYLEALGISWRNREALEQAELAAQHPDATEDDRAVFAAAAAFLRTDFDRVRARADAEAAMVLADDVGSEGARFVAAAALQMCLVCDGYLEEASEVARGLSDIGDRSTWSNRLITGGRLGGMIPDTRRFVGTDLVERYGTPSYSVNMLAIWGAMEDRFDAALELLGRLTTTDFPLNIQAWLGWQYTTLELASGRWDEALASAEAGLNVAAESGHHMAAAMIHEMLCTIATCRGRFDEARRHLAMIPGAMWTRALLAEAMGDDAMLAETLDGYRRSVYSEKPWLMYKMWLIGPDWIRLYLSAGDTEAARVLTEVVEEGARRGKTPSAEGGALRARGLLDRDADALLRAVDAYRRGPRVILTAQACEDAADQLASDGRRDEAIPLLREALETWEACDAALCISRVDAKLRELGVRRGKGRTPARPAFGWESLTEAELRVVSLVPEGLTYREIGERLFISKRTVETHIAHVFTKLGISSRRELANEVRDHLG